MKSDFLGDSYDLVKRFWGDLLRDTAPLLAEPHFIPDDLRTGDPGMDYTKLTGIPVLAGQHPNRYSILNDPDTGIRLPGRKQNSSRTHITLAAIVEQLKRPCIYCSITYDQSDYRNLNMAKAKQRQKKIKAITRDGCFGFYYVSHAPFLFAFKTKSAMRTVRKMILEAGIPASRIEG